MLKYIKSKINKDNLKSLAKEGARECVNIGIDAATEGTKSLINGIFYKIILIIILTGTLLIGGCVGTELILEMVRS